MAKVTEYTADSIDVNLGLDAVRASPQVFIGNPDSLGLFYCAKEAIDNGIDECLELQRTAGKGTLTVGVSLENDGTVWVYDPGRGIPIETHKTTKISTLTTVMTVLSAGAKMRAGKNGAGYKNSRGVHGMGISITNAMSKELTVYTCRDGQWWRQDFAKGKPTSKVEKTKAPTVPLAPDKYAKRTNGTVIRFKPDMTLFDKGSVLSAKAIKQFLQLTAYLHPSIKLVFADGKKDITYHEPQGLAAYAEKIAEEAGAVPVGKPFILDGEGLHVLLQWSDHDSELVKSFVNGSPTVEGRHVDGMNKAITESLAKYAGKKAKYKPEDLRTGLIAVLNLAVASPRFTTQTKEKLVTPEAVEDVYEPTKKALDAFWLKNKGAAKEIITKAIEIRNLVAAFQTNKKSAAKLRSKEGRALLPAKLATSTTKDWKRRELFLVEGDSAGGTAKGARDQEFQEILKLRGKVINAFGASGEKTMDNKEVQDILRAVGYETDANGVAKPFKSRVGKVVMLCDPDVDGKHITILLFTVLQRIVPQLFADGRVYVAGLGALYNVFYANKRYFGDSVEAVMAQLPKGVKLKEGVQRIKGWGEVKPDVLEQIAFNPKTRKLTRIKPLKGDSVRSFAYLMGKEAVARRELIGVNG